MDVMCALLLNLLDFFPISSLPPTLSFTCESLINLDTLTNPGKFARLALLFVAFEMSDPVSKSTLKALLSSQNNLSNTTQRRVGT